jgi:hypothetical protein
MSWWLSYPAQTYLDRQITNKVLQETEYVARENPPEVLTENVKAFEKLKRALQEGK